MQSAASIVRDARTSAGITQAELARRIRTSQSAIARLEAPGSNPRIGTLEAAVQACGRHLEIDAPAHPSGNVDETLVFEMLRMTPAQRLRTFEQSYRGIRSIAHAAARSRGEVA